MRFHQQSPIGYRFDDAGNFRGLGDRAAHYGLAVQCPVCQATHNCLDNGRRLSSLRVHLERAEAAL